MTENVIYPLKIESPNPSILYFWVERLIEKDEVIGLTLVTKDSHVYLEAHAYSKKINMPVILSLYITTAHVYYPLHMAMEQGVEELKQIGEHLKELGYKVEERIE